MIYRGRVGPVPRSSGTESLVFFCFDLWTRFTSGAPGLTYRTAARGFRHGRSHLVMANPLTTTIFHIHIAPSFPLIYGFGTKIFWLVYPIQCNQTFILKHRP